MLSLEVADSVVRRVLRPQETVAAAARAVLTQQQYAALRNRFRSLAKPNAPTCPVCEKTFAAFDKNPWGELSCPSCQSFPRSRATMLYLRARLGSAQTHQRILNIAPLKAKAQALEAMSGVTYVTADRPWATELYPSHSMLRADLENLPMNDGSFDLIVAIAVIQFVLRDDAMFDELARVLVGRGVLLLETTIFGETTEEIYTPDELATLEYAVNPQLDGLLVKQKYYEGGVLKHDPRQYVRQYGRDIEKRLARAGFTARAISYGELCAQAGRTPETFGLGPTRDHVLYECTKTGYPGGA